MAKKVEPMIELDIKVRYHHGDGKHHDTEHRVWSVDRFMQARVSEAAVEALKKNLPIRVERIR